MKQAHYLTIHFAPSTACIVVEINESQFCQLRDAMDQHSGEINLRVSASAEVVLGPSGQAGELR